MSKVSSGKHISLLKTYIIAFVVRRLIRIIGASCRLYYKCGNEKTQEILNSQSPIILCAWHNRIFYLGYWIETALLRKGFSLTHMVSQSKDGEISRIMSKWANLGVVRGSSNRDGSKALLTLYRAIKRDNNSIVMVPDGSHGPVYKAKAGTVVLAQLSGAPIYFFSYSVNRAWRIKSWDQLIIPKPFAKVNLSLCGPFHIPRRLNKKEVEKYRKFLEDSLNELRLESVFPL